MPITPGMRSTATTVVDETNTALTMGSGTVPVLATPAMVALMEEAAAACIAGELEPGQVSVGSHISVAHNAATPLGGNVSATATVVVADRRRVDFAVTAQDDAGEIGAGTHTRFIVEAEAFLQKAQQRKK